MENVQLWDNKLALEYVGNPGLPTYSSPLLFSSRPLIQSHINQSPKASHFKKHRTMDESIGISGSTGVGNEEQGQ